MVYLHLMMTRIGVKFRCKVVVSARESTLLIVTTEGRLFDYHLYHLSIQIPLDLKGKRDSLRPFA
jgi:hypothetical protein